MPSPLARDAVRSYRTISPLPEKKKVLSSAGGIFLLHFPSRHRAWTLSSLLPVGVRTFLHASPHSDPPTHSARPIITPRDNGAPPAEPVRPPRSVTMAVVAKTGIWCRRGDK